MLCSKTYGQMLVPVVEGYKKGGRPWEQEMEEAEEEKEKEKEELNDWDVYCFEIDFRFF